MIQFMQSKKCAKIHTAGAIGLNGEINEIDLNDEKAKLKYYKNYIDFLMIAQRQTEEQQRFTDCPAENGQLMKRCIIGMHVSCAFQRVKTHKESNHGSIGKTQRKDAIRNAEGKKSQEKKQVRNQPEIEARRNRADIHMVK